MAVFDEQKVTSFGAYDFEHLCCINDVCVRQSRSKIIRVDFDAAFERNPRICGGQPVIRGTRVPLRTVLASLAEGASFEDILKDFPTLNAEQLRAVVAFAASSAQEDLPVPGLPSR
jgi:uncharacterized protein (DUF433 family)